MIMNAEQSKTEKLVELEKLTQAGYIRVENRQIKRITCSGSFLRDDLHFTVYLEPLPDVAYWHNEVYLDAPEMRKFLSVFKPDFADQLREERLKVVGHFCNKDDWALDDFAGKYVRLVWQVTAPEDMHELAEDENLFAIKHIVYDTPKSIFFL